MSLLPHLRLEPTQSADACVIWLHGLGASGDDFAPVARYLALPKVRFILPHAPQMPVTVNNGHIMPAWYDLRASGRNDAVDTEGVQHSATQIAAFIDAERAAGMAADRIVLAGFSQGGAVAYHTALSYPQRLGGLLACSTYLATSDSLIRSDANHDLPIAVHHGHHDEVVMPARGKSAISQLQQWGYPVTEQWYPMGHEVCMPQLDDVRDWMLARLA
ncbi:alpha/beta hydrolase [Isoalcanivorax beigongshangi]|uniref:Alpha/beta hydrolase n=1 Tax=Isoalcanivorax beigongshangi TaxID=3238810 RepID=A0ABV4AEZ5_9GAMM